MSRVDLYALKLFKSLVLFCSMQI